jgi:hypothetical protein
MILTALAFSLIDKDGGCASGSNISSSRVDRCLDCSSSYFFFNKNDNRWVSWIKRSPVADGMSFLSALISLSVSI